MSIDSYDAGAVVRQRIGAGYAAEYTGYMDFFRLLAGRHGEPFTAWNVPRCWVPLITYLGGIVESTKRVKAWGDAEAVDWRAATRNAQDLRRVVEMSAAARPELTDALYVIDTQFPVVTHRHAMHDTFVVTTNGSFYRPEVLAYRRRLDGYEPRHKRAVIVPCTAVKPYPAPLHAAVLDRIRRAGLLGDYDVIVMSGVLGLVPADLWGEQPNYDAGLPNSERVQDTARWYFTKHRYERLVVYSDFNAHSLHMGLSQVPEAQVPHVVWCFGHYRRSSYENLLDEQYLQQLDAALVKAETIDE